ncbi:hypothetical protein ACTFIY_000004 [Dictyostelium cf. discoideum]
MAFLHENTGIRKLRPSSVKYQEIWDANRVFKHLYSLSGRSMVSFNTPDSIKGPVINAKEQRSGVLSILELTSLDDTNSPVCPVRHLATYLRASKGRRKTHSGDSVFINNEGQPLEVKHINNIVLSTLLKSGIDITRFKSHSTRSAIASMLLSNNVPIIGEKSGGFLNTVVQIS